MNRQSDRLPQGWKWAKLGDVCEIVSGSTPKTNVAAYWNGTITWITPTDMGQLPTKYIRSSQRTITQTGYASCSTKLIPAGAVVMSTRAPIGHLRIASVPLCTNQGCKTFVPGADVDTEFLYFSLLIHMEDIQALGSGSTFQEVSKTKLSKFEICLPPFIEQKRIAALLNQQMAYVEKARKAAEEILEAAQALPGAFLRQVFPAHGDVLPAGWKLRCLCDLCTYDRKTVTPSNPLAQTLAYIGLENVESNSGRIMLNTGDSSSGQVKGNSYRFDARHVLYGKLRPYLNKVVLPEFSGRCSTELIPLLPGPIDREYLAWYLRRPETVYYAMRSKTGSRMPRTDMKAFMQMPVLLPPLTEQKRIAALLKEQMAYVETVRMSAREQLDAINALPAALLRRAFAGTL